MILHQCIQQFECALVSVKSVIKLTQLKVSREKRVSGLQHCPCMRSIAVSWKRIFIILTSWHRPSYYRSRNQCGVLRLACGSDNPSVVVERQKAWSHDHSFPEGSQLLGPPGVSAAFLLPRKRQMPVWPPLSQSVWVEGWKGDEVAVRPNSTEGSARSLVQGGTFVFPGMSCFASWRVSVLQAGESCWLIHQTRSCLPHSSRCARGLEHDAFL